MGEPSSSHGPSRYQPTPRHDLIGPASATKDRVLRPGGLVPLTEVNVDDLTVGPRGSPSLWRRGDHPDGDSTETAGGFGGPKRIGLIAGAGKLDQRRGCQRAMLLPLIPKGPTLAARGGAAQGPDVKGKGNSSSPCRGATSLRERRC